MGLLVAGARSTGTTGKFSTFSVHLTVFLTLGGTQPHGWLRSWARKLNGDTRPMTKSMRSELCILSRHPAARQLTLRTSYLPSLWKYGRTARLSWTKSYAKPYGWRSRMQRCGGMWAPRHMSTAPAFRLVHMSSIPSATSISMRSCIQTHGVLILADRRPTSRMVTLDGAEVSTAARNGLLLRSIVANKHDRQDNLFGEAAGEVTDETHAGNPAPALGFYSG